MLFLIVDATKNSFYLKESNIRPVIGDRISSKYLPAPRVNNVILWPSIEDVKKFYDDPAKAPMGCVDAIVLIGD